MDNSFLVGDGSLAYFADLGLFASYFLLVQNLDAFALTNGTGGSALVGIILQIVGKAFSSMGFGHAAFSS